MKSNVWIYPASDWKFKDGEWRIKRKYGKFKREAIIPAVPFKSVKNENRHHTKRG
jgi:hypothetical protein